MPKNTLEIPVNVFLCLLRYLTFDRDSSDGNHGVRKICTLGQTVFYCRRYYGAWSRRMDLI